MNGVSKKLCTTMAVGVMVCQMSEGVDNKLPYAILITVLGVTYKVMQTIIDYKGKGKQDD